MFEIQILVNVLGLLGTVMIFKFSPQANSQGYFYEEKEMSEIKNKDKRKRTLANVGLYLVGFSFLLQLGLTIAQKYFVDSGH